MTLGNWTAAAAGIAAALFVGCVRRTGPMQTTAIDVPKPADRVQPVDVELALGEARVSADAGGDGVLQGTVTYNVPALKPQVTVDERRLQVVQLATGILPRHTRNEWRLRFGKGVPLSLSVTTGASDDEWELGGLSLRRITWIQGAGRSVLTFRERNPVRLEQFDLAAGAAAFTVRGLGNANIDVATFNAGAGAMKLVCDGTLTQDANLVVNGGIASLAVYSGGNRVQVVPEFPVAATNTGWVRSGDTYYSPEWAGSDGPALTIRTRLSLSVLRLVAGT